MNMDTRTRIAKRQIISLTERAAARVREVVAKAGRPVAGVRVSVANQGCSGLAYKIEYAETPLPLDERVEDKGVVVFVDPYAVMFIVGSEMDYVEDKLEARFVFNNPNEKGRCGCGESFHI